MSSSGVNDELEEHNEPQIPKLANDPVRSNIYHEIENSSLTSKMRQNNTKLNNQDGEIGSSSEIGVKFSKLETKLFTKPGERRDNAIIKSILDKVENSESETPNDAPKYNTKVTALLGREVNIVTSLNTTEFDIKSYGEKTNSTLFEELLEHVGNDGPYQWYIFVLASFGAIFGGWHSIAAVFLAASPDHICEINIPPSFSSENFTAERVRSNEKCEYYLSNITKPSANFSTDGMNRTVFKCSSWIYDDSIFKSTIVTEWDLVCEKQWLKSFAQSSFMMGVLIGSVVFGELSDMFGRRNSLLIGIVGFTTNSIAAAFSTNLKMFLILRFFIAFFESGFTVSYYVIVMEFTGQKIRSRLGIYNQLFFTFGFITLPGIAYLLPNWKHLQMAISFPMIILLLHFVLLPESPRWLLCQERETEAIEILGKVAKMNGKSLPEKRVLREMLSKFSKTERKDLRRSLFKEVIAFFKNQASLVKTPNLRRRCLIIFFSWFSVSVVYYGLTFSGSNINASIYVTVLLGGIVEIPAYVFTVFGLNRYGRKISIVASFIICSISCMLVIIVPKDFVWLNVTLTTVGKCFASAAFAIAFIYSAELVPTKVRNVAVGTSSMWARVGSMIAPFIVDLLGQFHYLVPSTIFSLLALTAGLFDLLLPETSYLPLPETIQEVENMKR